MSSTSVNTSSLPPPSNPNVHREAILRDIVRIHQRAADELVALYHDVESRWSEDSAALQAVVRQEILRHREFAFQSTDRPVRAESRHAPLPSWLSKAGETETRTEPSDQPRQTAQSHSSPTAAGPLSESQQDAQTSPPDIVPIRGPSLRNHPYAFPSLTKIYIRPRSIHRPTLSLTIVTQRTPRNSYSCLVPDMSFADFRYRVAGPESTAAVMFEWRPQGRSLRTLLGGEVQREKSGLLLDDETSLHQGITRLTKGKGWSDGRLVLIEDVES